MGGRSIRSFSSLFLSDWLRAVSGGEKQRPRGFANWLRAISGGGTEDGMISAKNIRVIKEILKVVLLRHWLRAVRGG